MSKRETIAAFEVGPVSAEDFAKCGCNMHVRDNKTPGGPPTLIFQLCPLHRAAPDLLAALEEQGGDPTGTWHLWSCPAGRNDMPVKPCLGECGRARAAIAKARGGE